ncbi:MAG: LEA type 2 family protein [Pseudomonadales bacterium]
MRHAVFLISLAFLLIMQGCASLSPDYDSPKVDVVGIEPAGDGGQALQFNIKLRILNPNSTPLNLSGIYYSLSIEGLDIVSGTARDLPEIAGFSEEIITVSAAASLINSIRLATKLMNQPSEELHYELRAKLGTTLSWMPSITVTDSGVIPLNGSTQNSNTRQPTTKF